MRERTNYSSLKLNFLLSYIDLLYAAYFLSRVVRTKFDTHSAIHPPPLVVEKEGRDVSSDWQDETTNFIFCQKWWKVGRSN